MEVCVFYIHENPYITYIQINNNKTKLCLTTHLRKQDVTRNSEEPSLRVPPPPIPSPIPKVTSV